VCGERIYESDNESSRTQPGLTGPGLSMITERGGAEARRRSKLMTPRLRVSASPRHAIARRRRYLTVPEPIAATAVATAATHVHGTARGIGRRPSPVSTNAAQ
jgi:hypothetical protein